MKKKFKQEGTGNAKVARPLVRAVYVALLMCARNYRSVSDLIIEMYKKFTRPAEIKEYPTLANLSEYSGLTLFQNICSFVSRIDISKQEILPLLTKSGVLDLLKESNGTKLTAKMKTIIVDALIAKHIALQIRAPLGQLSIKTGFAFSQFAKIFKFRDDAVLSIQDIDPEISETARNNNEVLAVILLALLPSVKDGNEASDKYIDLLKSFPIPQNSDFEHIFTAIFAVAHEFISESHLRSLSDVFYSLSPDGKFGWGLSKMLSQNRKRACIPLYPSKIGQNMLFVENLSMHLTATFSPLNMRYLGMLMSISKLEFESEVFCQTVAVEMIETLMSGRDCRLPRELITPTIVPNLSAETPYYEFIFRVRYYLWKVLDFSQTDFSQVVASSYTEENQLYILIRNEYKKAYPQSHFSKKIKAVTNKTTEHTSNADGKPLVAKNASESKGSDFANKISSEAPKIQIDEEKRVIIKKPEKKNAAHVPHFPSSFPQPNLTRNDKAAVTKNSPIPKIISGDEGPIKTVPASSLVLTTEGLESTLLQKCAPVSKYADDCDFTFDFIAKNCIIQENGLIQPKAKPSAEFIDCFYHRLLNGKPFPFKLTFNFFNFITTGKGLAEYKKMSDWGHSVPLPKRLDRMKLFIVTPLKDFKLVFEGHEIAETALLKDIITSLEDLDLGRLQTLIKLSAAAIPINQRSELEKDAELFRVRLDVSHDFCYVHRSWLHIPFFDDAEKLIEAIKKLLIEDTVVQVPKCNEKWKPKQKKVKEVKKSKAPVVNRNTVSNKALPTRTSDGLVQKIETAIDETLLEMATEKSLAEEASQTADVVENIGDSEKLVHIELDDTENEQFTFKVVEKDTQSEQLIDPSPVSTLGSFKIRDQSAILSSGNIQELVSNFEVFKYNVTQENVNSACYHLRSLLQSGNVEYIALDCEMTGLYTQQAEAAFKRGEVKRTAEVNVHNLIEGAMVNNMFQLGLAVKTRDGKISVWSIYTTPNLQQSDFTTGTFDYLFTESLEKEFPELPEEEIQNMVIEKMERIRRMSIRPDEYLRSIISLVLGGQAPLIVFSGYTDFLHLFKTIGERFDLNHEGIQFILKNNMDTRFCDIKITTAQFSETKDGNKLEHLVENFGIVPVFQKSNLHDASFDALLTAICYDYFRNHQIIFKRDVLFKVYY